jgi:hypothetical protein
MKDEGKEWEKTQNKTRKTVTSKLSFADALTNYWTCLYKLPSSIPFFMNIQHKLIQLHTLCSKVNEIFNSSPCRPWKNVS